MHTDDLMRLFSLLERISAAFERTADAVELLAAKADPPPPRPPEGSPPSKVHPLAALDIFRKSQNGPTDDRAVATRRVEAWGWLKPHLSGAERDELEGGVLMDRFPAWCDRVEARLKAEPGGEP